MAISHQTFCFACEPIRWITALIQNTSASKIKNRQKVIRILSGILLLAFISLLVSHLQELFTSNTTYFSLFDCRIFRKTFHHLIHFLTTIVAISFLKMYAVAIFLLYMKRALLRSSPAFQGEWLQEDSRPRLRRRGQGFQPPPLPLFPERTQASQAVLLCFISPSVLPSYRSQYILTKGYEVALTAENTTEKAWAFSSVHQVCRVQLHGLCSYASLCPGRTL